MPDSCVAVVLAAGVGSRVGDGEPKQFLELNGLSVLARAVANLAWCSRVIVVHHPDYLERTRRIVEQAGPTSPVPTSPGQTSPVPTTQLSLVPGGSTRRMSVLAAVNAVADLSDDVALVLQNAASPNTPQQVVLDCLAALATYEVVQAFVPATQTIVRHRDGELTEVLPRSSLGFHVDPTVFRLGCLRRIVAVQTVQAAVGSGGEMTTDTARELGIPIRLIPSPESNVKLTTRNDMIVLQSLLPAYGGQQDGATRAG